MKYIKNLGLFLAVVFALSGCMAVPMAVTMVQQMKHAQGRSENIDFAYAKEKVVVGETTKADITKNLGEPNQVIQDANEVWKYEQRVVFGFGSGSQGDLTQVFVAFNGTGVVTAIAGSDAQRKKEVKFTKGDLRLLPYMPGQSINMMAPQQPAGDSVPAPAAAQPAPAPAVEPVASPPVSPVKKAKAKVQVKQTSTVSASTTTQ